MISSILSLATEGFGMAFQAWLKLIVPIMLLETIGEMALINAIEGWTRKNAAADLEG